MLLTLLFPSVAEAPEGRPWECASCGSTYLARHGIIRRPLTDTVLSETTVQRYRCNKCGLTFRHYPSGVGRSRRSQRVEALAIVLRGVGLSCIASANVLRDAGVKISQASVWRAARKAGLRDQSSGKRRRRVRIRVLKTGQAPDNQPSGLQLRFIVHPETGEKLGAEFWTQRNVTIPKSIHEFLDAIGATLTIEQEVSQTA